MDAHDALEHRHHAEDAAQSSETLARRAAILVSILAALLAIAAIAANRAMTEALLAQQQASDAWNEFQANSLKRHVHEGDAALLRILAAGTPNEAEARQRAAALEADVATKYRPNQDTLPYQAQDLEHERDLAHWRHRRFELAETGLQLAIVLSSIAIVARATALLWAGGVLGVVSLFTLLNGFFIWVSGPF
jgi:hypothetical protein